MPKRAQYGDLCSVGFPPFGSTPVRDRFTGRQSGEEAVKEITARAWACISMRAGVTLTLLDLRGDGCTRIGEPTDAVNTRNHAAGRAYAKAIHVDGIVDASHLSGEDAYAVFDRSTGKLTSIETGLLEEHPELPNVLRRYGISLVTWE